jgi:hypothetical protein
MTKEEMATVMPNAKKISQRWRVKVVNTTMHIINRTYFKPHTNKTTCEIWNGQKLQLNYFHVFGSKYYILNNREKLGKFEERSDEEIFL